MTLDLAFWIAAFVCFLLAATIGDRIPRLNLTALGLALASLTFIIS